MNAAVGRGTAKARFVARAVNVNIAFVGIDISATIESRLQTFQPENPVCDRRKGLPIPGVASEVATFENRSDRPAAAGFFRDAMKSAWRHVRAGNFANSETRSGAAICFQQMVVWKARFRKLAKALCKEKKRLPRDIYRDNKTRWKNSEPLTSEGTCPELGNRMR